MNDPQHTFSEVVKYRERGTTAWNSFANGPMWTMEDLPLSDEQKELVLEWYARKLFEALCRLGIQDGSGKSYDPLSIDGDRRIAHSYVFELGDGGRHHPFKSYAELEERLTQEIVNEVKEYEGDDAAT